MIRNKNKNKGKVRMRGTPGAFGKCKNKNKPVKVA